MSYHILQRIVFGVPPLSIFYVPKDFLKQTTNKRNRKSANLWAQTMQMREKSEGKGNWAKSETEMKELNVPRRNDFVGYF